MKKKVEYQQIHEYIDKLRYSQWLGSSQRWWPKFVFHFTNINNALKILETECLYPRSKAITQGLMVNDNASCDVIGNTDPKWFDYVRLYFRPRTPTQWHNEGFIPVEQRHQQAHCPMPIYFLFDSKSILSRDDVLFSNASLARRDDKVKVYSNVEEFMELPFEYIYHDSSFCGTQRDLIIGARQAEILVPEILDLIDLKHIWCRSEAEYNTLLHLLSPRIRSKWKNKIGAGKKGNLFYRRWIFVERAELNTEQITLYFNIPQETCVAFPIKVQLHERKTGIMYYWQDLSYQPPDNYKLELSLRNLKHPDEYVIELFMGEQLMYADKFTDGDSVPF